MVDSSLSLPLSLSSSLAHTHIMLPALLCTWRSVHFPDLDCHQHTGGSSRPHLEAETAQRDSDWLQPSINVLSLVRRTSKGVVWLIRRGTSPVPVSAVRCLSPGWKTFWSNFSARSSPFTQTLIPSAAGALAVAANRMCHRGSQQTLRLFTVGDDNK